VVEAAGELLAVAAVSIFPRKWECESQETGMRQQPVRVRRNPQKYALAFSDVGVWGMRLVFNAGLRGIRFRSGVEPTHVRQIAGGVTPDCDQFRSDSDCNFLRRDGADVEAHGRVNAVEQMCRDSLLQQRFVDFDDFAP
jgi:hypothetical protein